ncbi:TPA: hypothetical protein ACGXMZ_005107 [Bacillus albus]
MDLFSLFKGIGGFLSNQKLEKVIKDKEDYSHLRVLLEQAYDLSYVIEDTINIDLDINKKLDLTKYESLSRHTDSLLKKILDDDYIKNDKNLLVPIRKYNVVTAKLEKALVDKNYVLASDYKNEQNKAGKEILRRVINRVVGLMESLGIF